MFSRHMCQHMGQVPGTSYKLSNSKSLPATLGQSHSRPDAYQMSWGIHGRASPGKPLLPSRVPHQIQILSCCRLDMNRHSGQHNRQDRETCTDAGVGNEVQVYGSKDIIWPLLPRNIHPFSHPPLQLCSTPVQVGTISLECLIQWHLRLIIPQQMQMVWDEVVSNESQQAFQQLPPHLRNDMVQKGNEQGLSVVLLEACGYEDIMGNLLATHHGEVWGDLILMRYFIVPGHKAWVPLPLIFRNLWMTRLASLDKLMGSVSACCMSWGKDLVYEDVLNTKHHHQKVKLADRIF